MVNKIIVKFSIFSGTFEHVLRFVFGQRDHPEQIWSLNLARNYN
jgi:hypothetical protein